jgi:hypothetical protein
MNMGDGFVGFDNLSNECSAVIANRVGREVEVGKGSISSREVFHESLDTRTRNLISGEVEDGELRLLSQVGSEGLNAIISDSIVVEVDAGEAGIGCNTLGNLGSTSSSYLVAGKV